MNDREVLSKYVYTIVSALVASGVEQVVVSPGSRSTPLAYAFASTKEIEMHRQVDERAAAFYALGLAKSTAKPVVLVCTDRKSTRLNSSHVKISYAVFCLKKKKSHKY